MNRRLVLLGCLLLLVLSPAVTAAAETVVRVYEVRYLDANEAGLLARQTCLKLGSQECEFRVKGAGFFEFFANGAVQEEVRSMLLERDVPPPTQVFQVTLLIAREQPPRRPALPESAKAALDDLQSFLPFRSYELLDSGLIRTADRSSVSLGGALGYRAELRYRGDRRPATGMHVDFELSRRHSRPSTSSPEGSTQEQPDYAWRTVVSTSFSMEDDETVVVGTSKLDGGDEALIVLLTALSG